MTLPTPEELRDRFPQAWESTAARCQAPIYLVGSYLRDPEAALDIDIVAALGDFDRPRWFDRLRAQVKLSESLSAQTKIPIDFKIQNGIAFAGIAADAEHKPFLLAEPGIPIRRENEPERVLCAAIYVDTGKAEPPRRSYAYPATGLVFAGWRHSDCFTLMNDWANHLTEKEKAAIEAVQEYQLHGRNQGFLTSKGRYVDRREAWEIAFDAGQIPDLRRKGEGPILCSEDLY
jgi:hypothetical protein